ncbi:MAG TPA: hypothetical protein VEJ23_04880 [Solirubrobacteraceae bacterium]|nr:hypothetical protein [Solirubrobacteraceae bacterium]
MSTTMVPDDMVPGLDFCAERYQATYNTHWVTRPDVLFTARRSGRVVSTVGLELGSKRAEIDAEHYFLLSPGMRAFLDGHRSRIAEFGRFASDDWAGTRAVVHASIAFMRQSGIEFFFAFAPPGVYLHMRDHLGIPLCSIDVPVNQLVVQTDTSWSVPPIDYFLREQAPHVVVGIVPFLDVVDHRLALESGTSPLSFLI